MSKPQSVVLGGIHVTWDGRSFSWTSGMAIDADGSPRAYAPIGSGLVGIDDLRNAGSPGKWYGLACKAGVPYVQQPGDPFPGMYVPQTELQDSRFAVNDPRRYCNSEAFPFVSVPRELAAMGCNRGDLAMVVRGPLRCGAVVADVGPAGKLGEGSICLAQVLGWDPFQAKPRHLLVGPDEGVSFRIFPGTASSPRWPRPNLQAAALALVNAT